MTPTKQELTDNLTRNNREMDRTSKLLRERIARIDQLNAEIDAMQKRWDDDVDTYIESVSINTQAVVKEMLELARMESPEYAIAYVESALSQFPLYEEEQGKDVRLFEPNQIVLADLRSGK